MSLSLVDVYSVRLDATIYLYDLLAERDPVANISHLAMPTFVEHFAFVKSKPYKAWYLIMREEPRGPIPVGAIYITEKNEIGISIKKVHQGQHYAKAAITALMEKHPEPQYLANIAPGNARSVAMFEGLGFDLIQLTLRKEKS